MRFVFCLVMVFGFLAWDVSANNGHYTHVVSAQINNLGAQLGLW